LEIRSAAKSSIDNCARPSPVRAQRHVVLAAVAEFPCKIVATQMLQLVGDLEGAAPDPAWTSVVASRGGYYTAAAAAGDGVL
jgi:hypothetical protein